MPLHIHIDINDYPLSSLHIGRIKGGTNPKDINTYKVVLGAAPKTDKEWLDGVEFTHAYGDGAEICLMKAIAALSAAGKLPRKT